jgi:hypothetical protein
MKKFILMLGMFLLPVLIFAQVDTTGTNPNPPQGWNDILMNPGVWFASFAGVSLLTAFLAAFFNGLLKITKSFPKQLCAWVVAILLLVVTDLVNFGYAKDFPILLAVIHGFAAGLASNGVFDIPFMKSILDAIQGWFNPKPLP